MSQTEIIAVLEDLLDTVNRRIRMSNDSAKDKWTAVAGHLEYALRRARHDY